jgi:hypothetical protein
MTSEKSKKRLYGFKTDKIDDMTKSVQPLNDKTYMVKFISSNKEEDFGIYD